MPQIDGIRIKTDPLIAAAFETICPIRDFGVLTTARATRKLNPNRSPVKPKV